MSLAHAILGILRDRPMTGYDLKTHCFDLSIAHFWPADQAQIYRTLDRMSADGWVASDLELQAGRPNRKVYCLTAAGQEELTNWLQREQPLTAYREPFLIQLYFATELPTATIRRLLAQQRALHEQLLARYRAIPAPQIDEPTLDRDTALRFLTLDLGIALEQAQLAWLERADAIIGALPEREREAEVPPPTPR